MIKKYKLHILLAVLLSAFTSMQVSASCWWVLTPGINNWTAASNCTVSNGLYSIWWDATIGTRTVTIASNAALIMNFDSKKMTFSTGKVLMSGGAVVYGNTAGYQFYGPDSSVTTSTSCSSWQRAWNPITRNFIPSGTDVNASYSWWVVCKAFGWSTPGTCGIADGVWAGSPPSSNLCHAGSASSVTSSWGTYSWTCTAGWVTVNCDAPYSVGTWKNYTWYAQEWPQCSGNNFPTGTCSPVGSQCWISQTYYWNTYYSSHTCE